MMTTYEYNTTYTYVMNHMCTENECVCILHTHAFSQMDLFVIYLPSRLSIKINNTMIDANNELELYFIH